MSMNIQGPQKPGDFWGKAGVSVLPLETSLIQPGSNLVLVLFKDWVTKI